MYNLGILRIYLKIASDLREHVHGLRHARERRLDLARDRVAHLDCLHCHLLRPEAAAQLGPRDELLLVDDLVGGAAPQLLAEEGFVPLDL